MSIQEEHKTTTKRNATKLFDEKRTSLTSRMKNEACQTPSAFDVKGVVLL